MSYAASVESGSYGGIAIMDAGRMDGGHARGALAHEIVRARQTRISAKHYNDYVVERNDFLASAIVVASVACTPLPNRLHWSSVLTKTSFVEFGGELFYNLMCETHVELNVRIGIVCWFNSCVACNLKP